LTNEDITVPTLFLNLQAYFINKKTKNEALGRIDLAGFHAAKKAPIVLVLDDIRSLNNIGSVFRTGDAFRISEIVLCGITAQPPHRDIRKTALGATESVSWRYFANNMKAIEDLKGKDYKIVCLEQAEHSTLLQDYSPKSSDKLAIVLGNEVRGVSQDIVDVSDVCLEIPQFGTKHSFNVSVSCGMVLWDVVGKMGLLTSL